MLLPLEWWDEVVSYSQRIFWEIQEIRVFLLRNEPKRTHQNCHEIWISWQPQTWEAKQSVMVPKSRLHAPKINSLFAPEF